MRGMVQLLTLTLMLVIGIFVGIDTAEKNIQKMQGIEGAPQAIQVTPVNGKVEITVLGHNIQTQNPLSNVDGKKIEQVKETVQQGGSFLSEVGNWIGTGIRDSTRKMLEAVFGWIS
jgi:hypothetical protein